MLGDVRNILTADDLQSTMFSLNQKFAQVHGHMIKMALEFELCGGMPAAVQKFLTTSDLVACRDIQLDILTSFRDDFAKYVQLSIISEKIRDNIDAVLRSMESLARRVKISRISTSHSETVKKAIDMLEDIGIVYRVLYTNSFDSPLSSGMSPVDYRLFLCDFGLFHALTGSAIPEVITPDIHFANDGVLGEYFLITELIKRSNYKKKVHDVYFWENKKKSDGAEIDALVYTGQTLCAIDAKRKRQKISPSLLSFKMRYDNYDNNRKPKLLSIVSSMDLPLFLRDGIVNIPYYMTPFIIR
jgi:hypothetical protein